MKRDVGQPKNSLSLSLFLCLFVSLSLKALFSLEANFQMISLSLDSTSLCNSRAAHAESRGAPGDMEEWEGQTSLVI